MILITAIPTGCSSGIEIGDARGSCQLREPEPTDNLRVVVSSFWMENPQERSALDVLLARAGHVDLSAIPEARIGRADVQLTLAENLQKQKDADGVSLLPDVYQVNGGSDVLQYVEEDSPPELCSLAELDQRYGFRGRIFDSAWAPSACDDALYALPLSIHRLNLIHFNVEVDSAARTVAQSRGLTFPELESVQTVEGFLDLLALFDSLDLVAEDGDEVVPFALGIGREEDHSWALQHLAFENFLLSYGLSLYQGYFRGEGRFTPEEVRDLVARLSSDLARLGELGRPMTGMDWDETILAVAEGRAWLTVGGDWLRAQPQEETLAQVKTQPFAGTEAAFVYTPDSFAVPRLQGSDGASAHKWFRDVISNRSTQIDFARVKSAIPSLQGLSDAEISRLKSPYLADSYRRFSECSREAQSCTAILAVSGLAPPPGHHPCFDRIGLVLALLAGEAAELSARDASACSRPFPSNRAEAEDELVEILFQMSQHGFAPRCRHSN